MLNRHSFLHPHDIFHILQPCIHMKLYWEDFQEQPEDQFISMPFWNVHASLRVAKCFPSIAVPCDTFDTNVALLQHLWEKSSQAERNNSENLARLLVCMQKAVFIQGLGAAASIQFEEELFTCIFDILLRTFCIWKSVHRAIILLFVHHVECFAFAMTVDYRHGVRCRNPSQHAETAMLAGFWSAEFHGCCTTSWGCWSTSELAFACATSMTSKSVSKDAKRPGGELAKQRNVLFRGMTRATSEC